MKRVGGCVRRLFVSFTLMCGGLLAQAGLAQSAGDTARERLLWAERVIAGRDCPACDLKGVDLSYQDLEGRDLTGADLRDAELSLVTLDLSGLAGAQLNGAVLVGAKLGFADLTGADLSGARLEAAWLGSARLSDAVLDGADLSGAWLANVHGLTQEQLDDACGDEATRLPDGLSVAACPD